MVDEVTSLVHVRGATMIVRLGDIIDKEHEHFNARQTTNNTHVNMAWGKYLYSLSTLSLTL